MTVRSNMIGLRSLEHDKDTNTKLTFIKSNLLTISPNIKIQQMFLKKSFNILLS